nr:MAG TPA: hypothetical protein [Caudoviricetes sp.]
MQGISQYFFTFYRSIFLYKVKLLLYKGINLR